MEEFVGEEGELRGEWGGDVVDGDGVGRGRGGWNEVGEGLGVGEVDVGVEEGRVSILRGWGGRGWLGDKEVDELVEDVGGWVGGDLGGMVRSVRVGGREKGEEEWVDDLWLGGEDMGEGESIRWGLG